MKRLLPVIPIIFLFLINSCSPTPPMSENEMLTAIALTHTAEAWVPVPTQTNIPEIKTFMDVLNSDLYAVSSLGWLMDVQYYVTNVTYMSESERIARIDVDCACMNSTDCCNPERTFVVIVDSMKRNSPKIPPQVFGGTDKVVVVCLDHITKNKVGAMSASWQDIQNYLRDSSYGVQLSAHTSRTEVP